MAKLPVELSTRTVVAYRGELAAIIAQAGGEIDLDGSDVKIIDTAGLQILLACHKSVSLAGGKLSLSRCSPLLLEALDLAGVRDRLGAEGAA
jgi:anti-anti-sigma regulatory factor